MMENRNVIRFVFTKKDGLKYISHLDLQRAISRIIKRSHIPIRYTQGFNPHPKMVFGLTLSVGCESECEMLDVYMVMDETRPNVPLYTPDEFKEAIIPNLPKGLDFVDAYYPELPFANIKTALYEVTLEMNSEEDISENLNRLFNQPIIVFKKSKAGDRDVDIRPLISSYSYRQNGKIGVLMLELSAEQNNYLNPELVMTGIKKDQKISDFLMYYNIIRKKINYSV